MANTNKKDKTTYTQEFRETAIKLALLDKWAYQHGVTIDFSRPGKPTDNAYVESFNGRFREEGEASHIIIFSNSSR